MDNTRIVRLEERIAALEARIAELERLRAQTWTTTPFTTWGTGTANPPPAPNYTVTASNV